MIKSLPPEPKLRLDSEILSLLNSADASLYRLDSLLTLWDENHFIPRILKLREASQSLKIDRRPASLSEFFTRQCFDDLEESAQIKNYLNASGMGMRLLRDVSSSGHIIKSIQSELIKGSSSLLNRENIFRGTNQTIKENVNGRNLKQIPPPEEIPFLMERLENYIASDISYPPLINAALIHAQFEMIHPFNSHNGLTGRILLQLHLQWKKWFVNNCLQISEELNKQKEEYFHQLESLGNGGSWIEWIKFFLSIIVASSKNTIRIIKNVYSLEREGFEKILSSSTATTAVLNIYRYIYIQPILTIPHITKTLSFTKQTANFVVSKLFEIEILGEVTGKQRYRMFTNKKFLELIEP